MIPRLGGAQNGTSADKAAAGRALARELLGHERPAAGDQAAIETMERAFTRVSENLRRSIGEDGFRALVGRALARVQSDQSVWITMRHAGLGIDLDVAAAMDRHGAAPVAAALESLVAAQFDILSDLIGAEMARNLLAHDPTHVALAGGPS